MANRLAVSTSWKRPTIALWIVEAGFVGFWIFVVATRLPTVPPLALWAIAVAIILVLLALAGREINGQWFGVLIDTRNKLSLARFQIILWTVMVLSAYLTMALIRVRAMVGVDATLNQEQALDIKFPAELILAMGIGAASFAGSSLIKASKTTRQLTLDAKTTPDAAKARRDKAQAEFNECELKLKERAQEQAVRKQALDAAVQALAANPADAALQKAEAKAQTLHEVAVLNTATATKDRDTKTKTLEEADAELKMITEAQGLLHKNAEPSDAGWVDLFRGEEIGNYKLVDMSKVQMLFFTVVVIVSYSAAVSSMLGDLATLVREPTLGFPDFNDTLNALLGISHGTYLSVKAVDHS
jgi:hypothetical protein